MSLARLVDWLWFAFQSLSILIHNVIVRVFNKLIEGVAAAGDLAIQSLPTYTAPTPGQLIDGIGFISALNWVLPIGFFIDCMTMFIFGYLAFNASAPILRWTRLIR
ncbi:MAG: hypothetical protein LWW87_06955 [Geobacteraceae bacterium]|nr:hypothetical protein [Geobacteraceae bacterium]